jgi:hypothetical protein
MNNAVSVVDVMRWVHNIRYSVDMFEVNREQQSMGGGVPNHLAIVAP